MDRTEELWRVVRVFASDGDVLQGRHNGKEREKTFSPYLRIALRVSSALDQNEILVSKMEVLADRKEFSNDPTVEMSAIGESFQKRAALVQADMTTLKRLSESGHVNVSSNNNNNNSHGSSNNDNSDGCAHQQQHYKLMLQALTKRYGLQIEAFKGAVKKHAHNVEQRNKRVNKYGLASGGVGSSSSSSSSSSSGGGGAAAAGGGIGAERKYAMFANTHTQQREEVTPISSFASQELRRRTGNAVPPSFAAAPPQAGATSSSSSSSISSSSSSSSSGVKKGALRSSDASGSMFVHRSPYGTTNSSQQQQMLLQQQPQAQAVRSDFRMRSAAKVEASITQMGELFSQMAQLVMVQSETIARIEDDVENGLEDTIEGHKSMTAFQEITRGNRSMILKIFALLIFFIFLFLVWS